MGATQYIHMAAMLGSVITLVGSMVFLFKQKTIVREDGSTEIEIPYFGRLKSNYPSVIMGFIGAGLAAYTLDRVGSEGPPMGLSAILTVSAQAATNDLPVFVGVVPQEYFTSTNLDANGAGTLSFTVDSNKSYSVVALKPIEVTSDGVRFASTHGPAIIEAGKMLFEGELK